MARDALILAADVGGTNARFALFEAIDARLRIVVEQRYGTTTAHDLVDILARFRRDHDAPIAAAGIAVAGAVRDGVAEGPNLPWTVRADALARQLGGRPVALLNDLEANAWGVLQLPPDDLLELNRGAPVAAGTRAVIAAGTGLGQAALLFDGARVRALASEGGHADFAPGDEREQELLRWLAARHEHVSWERVLSGPGLQALYEFLVSRGVRDSPRVRAALANGDGPAIITEAALHGDCALCLEVVEWFVSLYGAAAGNVGLHYLATGGVYLGGGIAPRIAGQFARGRFMRAFTTKGRMRPLLERMPVHLILNAGTALLGAAECARRTIPGTAV